MHLSEKYLIETFNLIENFNKFSITINHPNKNH